MASTMLRCFLRICVKERKGKGKGGRKGKGEGEGKGKGEGEEKGEGEAEGEGRIYIKIFLKTFCNFCTSAAGGILFGLFSFL